MEGLLETFRQTLSAAARVLTPQDEGYDQSLQRWSNLDFDYPAAVVQPASESDAVICVRETVKASIPFVLASGRHSSWSTIDKKGIVIDLARYKSIEVDAEQHTVKVRGAVLMKEFQTALSAKGQFSTVGNGGTVGVIPYMLGGGISIYGPLIGYGCENILAARMITAAGDVVEASETKNQDLLWATRGAGQLLGLISELTLRTYDLTVIGPAGVRQIGTMIFPVERAYEACEVLKDIVTQDNHVSAGHYMVMNNPTGQPGRILMLAPQYFGTAEEMTAAFQPLLDLGPTLHQATDCTFEAHSDHLGWMLTYDGYKRFSQTGMTGIDSKHFVQLSDLHDELVRTVPDAGRSIFTVEWHSPAPTVCGGPRDTPTAFGCKDVHIWLNVLAWYEDPAYHQQMLDFDARAQAIVRAESAPEAYVACAQTSRDDPIEYRYKGDGVVNKLKAVKHKWDPKGVFTRQLL